MWMDQLPPVAAGTGASIDETKLRDSVLVASGEDRVRRPVLSADALAGFTDRGVTFTERKKNGSTEKLTAELKASERRESSSQNRGCRRESKDHPRLRGSVHYESFDWR